MREQLRLELEDAADVLNSIDATSAGELGPDIFGVMGMANEVIEALARQTSPLNAHVTAADLIGRAASRLDAAATSHGFGPDMRRFIYEASYFIGQAGGMIQASDLNRSVAVRGRQQGLVVDKVKALILRNPDLSGSKIADLLEKQYGQTTTPQFVNRTKRKMETTR